jgi:uncharacterized repeat protein (TIGR03943 family)
MAVSPRSGARPINYVVLFEVFLLGGTATLLMIKWLRGQLSFYIHPRYDALMVVAAVVLLLMAAAHLRDVFSGRPPHGSRWFYLLLAVPLLLGTLVPARPLGADTLAGRGVDLTAAGAVSARRELAGDPASWNLLEWATALTLRGDELAGSNADVVGFVFTEPTLGADAFYVVRYVVTCCAADGAVVGLPVLWPEGASLSPNSWVRVRGTIELAELGGTQQPALRAETVEPVDQPASPYLYP